MPLIKKSDVKRHFASKLSVLRAAGAARDGVRAQSPSKESVRAVEQTSHEVEIVPNVIEIFPASASKTVK